MLLALQISRKTQSVVFFTYDRHSQFFYANDSTLLRYQSSTTFSNISEAPFTFLTKRVQNWKEILESDSSEKKRKKKLFKSIIDETKNIFFRFLLRFVLNNPIKHDAFVQINASFLVREGFASSGKIDVFTFPKSISFFLSFSAHSRGKLWANKDL